jgi:hypothetical protein
LVGWLVSNRHENCMAEQAMIKVQFKRTASTC